MLVGFVCVICGDVHASSNMKLPDSITTSKDKETSRFYFHCVVCEINYTREDVGPIDPSDALSLANDWNDWERQLGSWRRSCSYRWVKDHIVYPISLEETRRRASILAFAYRFMSAYYHWKKRVLITHVAIRCNGKVYSLPKPNRHHHVIWMIAKEIDNRVDASGDDQGFLDENGVYYDRRSALILALKNNQVKDMKDIRAGRLFSENLW